MCCRCLSRSSPLTSVPLTLHVSAAGIPLQVLRIIAGALISRISVTLLVFQKSEIVASGFLALLD